MKLLIILAFLSSVYCGINNSITVLGNGTIYLAHTCNSAIYEITPTTLNTFTATIVIGDITGAIKGDIDNFNGLNARVENPRSIINSNDSLLFFVDNDKYIKRVNISSDIIKGKEIASITTITHKNVFTHTSYNYAGSHDSTAIIYFVSLDTIYKIDLNIGQDHANAVTPSLNILDTGSNFINISFYNGNLFYCYSNNDTYYFKQSANSNNFNVYTDDTLILTYTPNITDVKGFTFTSNYLIITGTSNNETKILRFNYTDYETISSTNIQVSDEKYSALVDYNTIYGNTTDANTYIIGRRAVGSDGFYKININDIRDVTPIPISEIYNIKVNNSYNISSYYLFNNKFRAAANLNNYRMIHFKQNTSTINLVQYEHAIYSTSKLKFTLGTTNLFDSAYVGIISNITIDKEGTLYIAEYKNDTSSSIYCCKDIKKDIKADHASYLLTLLKTTPEIEGKISSINYNHFNKSLHFITDKHYYKYKVLNETSSIIFNGKLSNLDNIQQTNDTDSLENINDFVIDTDYEIGYIAFEKRLKWFYV